MYTYIDVSPNANCPMTANLVFKNISDPRRISMVRLFEGEPGGRLVDVTGWSNAGAPCDALAVQVEDSSEGSAYLVYGGDWGIRLRPPDAAEWSLYDPDQWGETHLVLADAEDIIPAPG